MSVIGRIARILRYPVKGLTGEDLRRTEIRPGIGIPGDRALGLKFADAPPGWQGKHLFLQLTNTPALAALDVSFDPETETLVVRRDGDEVLQARGVEDAPRVEAFFARYAAAATGSSRAVRLERERFPDSPGFDLTLVFKSTVAAVAEQLGAPFEEERLRMNLVVDGDDLPAFGEFALVGRRLRAGDARLEVSERLPRCPATHVNPGSGRRDLDLLDLLERWQGHRDLGVFLKVRESGVIEPGFSLCGA